MWDKQIYHISFAVEKTERYFTGALRASLTLAIFYIFTYSLSLKVIINHNSFPYVVLIYEFLNYPCYC